MKLKFKEQIEREMEVEIPCYRTNGTFIVKVLGENESLSISPDGKWFSHREGIFWGIEDYFKRDWKESTREEFDAAVKKFESTYKDQIIKHFEAVEA